MNAAQPLTAPRQCLPPRVTCACQVTARPSTKNVTS